MVVSLYLWVCVCESVKWAFYRCTNLALVFDGAMVDSSVSHGQIDTDTAVSTDSLTSHGQTAQAVLVSMVVSSVSPMCFDTSLERRKGIRHSFFCC